MMTAAIGSNNSDGTSQRSLVTGGTGLIGRMVVKLLREKGDHVTTVSMDSLSVEGATHHVQTDLTDYDACLSVTQGVDAIYHLAGIKGSLRMTEQHPASFMVPMLRFNTNLLEAARLNGIEKLVYTSSIGAYSPAEVFFESEGFDGEPMDMFPGWAKRVGEVQVQAYRREFGLDWAVVRPSNVYGPGDNFDPSNAMVIPSLMARIKGGENPLTVWGDGTAVRDFAYSEDVARGIVAAAQRGTRGSFVNLGAGQGYSIRELLETMHDFMDFEFRFDPSRPSGFPRRVMDISRARDWLGYEPQVSLREGLERTWSWYLSNSDEHLQKKNYFKNLSK